MEQLLADLRRAGIRLRLDEGELHVVAPPGSLTEALRESLRSQKEPLLRMLQAQVQRPAPRPDTADAASVTDASQRFQPFPLTDLQHAYWMGREPGMPMGGVATHMYLEFDGHDLEPARLQQALGRMIERHDMLRTVVGGDGLQRVLEVVPRYDIAVTDCRDAEPERSRQVLDETRAALSHQVLPPDRWPLFDIRATWLTDRLVRLHVSLDHLLLDALSVVTFFQEWKRFYVDPDWTPPLPGISFRDYVMAENRSRTSVAYQRDQAYWMARIDTLPPPPDLPLRHGVGGPPRFSRREATLSAVKWAALKDRARHHGITPSSMLLAAYSQVLARWSATQCFAVNVVTSLRQPFHPDVKQVLGDFSSPVPVEVDLRPLQLGFAASAQALQVQLLTDAEHSRFNGVAFMREWAKRRGEAGRVTMPVVFSSSLIWSGEEASFLPKEFGPKVYGIGQASQVWLDHQMHESDGQLNYNWDAVDSIFQEGVLDAMYGAYQDLIEELSQDDEAWTRPETVALPEVMQRVRDAAPDSGHLLPADRLHAGFVRQAMNRPQALAVVSEGRTLTYGQLLSESVAVADWLIRQGIRAEQPVAVLMRKGWRQIVAVYGVLLAGGAYLPIDADLPRLRQLELLRQGSVKQVLVQADTAHAEFVQAGYALHEVHAGTAGVLTDVHLQSLAGDPGELAYVIFTSGTTGVPKGVMIEHRGAVNTLHHVNKLCEVGPNDRVLGVSSLSFDLSVYDIFGLHAEGGALVLPDHDRRNDPAHWLSLMNEHGVTRWNSAPQLMAMLMDSVEVASHRAVPLRSVLLSGDFVPLDLPDRIRLHHPLVDVISLGGATEASVWSIYRRVDKVLPAWSSIPYGKPLANQTVQVLDERLRPVPDHVKGRIFIGGAGLARGYWGDSGLTAARFIIHPESGERLYDTGDLGRYAPDGDVVILGRVDGQVKIRGHRVETGEIEAVLRGHPGVRQAVVLATGASAQSRRLVAFVEPTRDDAQFSSTVIAQSLKDHLGDRLPDYMVPRTVVIVPQMPVSPNGKLDFQSLLLHTDAHDLQPASVAPRTPLEHAILAAWSRVLPHGDFGVTDSFFDLGGDSVLVMGLLRELNAELFPRLELHELFEHLTIASLAELWQQRESERAAALPDDRSGTSSRAASIAGPAGLASKDRLETDVADGQSAMSSWPVPIRIPRGHDGTVFLTGATGWVGTHMLHELLRATQANVVCLVRADGKSAAAALLAKRMQQVGLPLDVSQLSRVTFVTGDLGQPRFGMSSDEWASLCASVDRIYHFGASVGILQGYEWHRAHNVHPLGDLLTLAATGEVKPIVTLSPLAVCRRVNAGRLEVLSDERVHRNSDGLRTGYAQSKWVAEQILWAAAEKGLPVRIYRSSHALPSAGQGRSKPNDTYATVLTIASRVDVVPDWEQARIHGIPVDRLCELLVHDAWRQASNSAVVHLEHRTPPRMVDVISSWIRSRLGTDCGAPVPLLQWQRACLSAIDSLPETQQALARVLFETRSDRMAVENMFSAHTFETGNAEATLLSDQLCNLTPSTYWCRVMEVAGAAAEHGRDGMRSIEERQHA